MSFNANQLMNYFKDPLKEIETVRKGINPDLIEAFLNEQSFVVKDVLGRLKITTSTYFAKVKKTACFLGKFTAPKREDSNH